MKKNKIFIFVILLFSFVVLFATNSFASYEVSENGGFVYTDKNGNTFNLPAYPDRLSEYNHYVIIKSTIWDTFYLFPFNETFEVTENGDYSFKLLADGVDATKFYWSCDFGHDSSEVWDLTSDGVTFCFNKRNNPYYVVSSCSCFSNYCNNLQNVLDGTDSFFLNRNQVLAPIVEKTGLTGVLQEIAEILPIVLVIIVGLIGLRKALKMLSTVLHRS